LSECFVFGRRAALAALEEPEPAGASTDSASHSPALGGVERATRAALWEHAGILRSKAGLEALARDTHPLARLIARAALEREETRGTHARGDYPRRDPRLDGKHVVLEEHDRLGWRDWR
jgi:L-aspartate oxidase